MLFFRKVSFWPLAESFGVYFFTQTSLQDLWLLKLQLKGKSTKIRWDYSCNRANMSLVLRKPGPTKTRLYSHWRKLEIQIGIQEVEGLYYPCSENKSTGSVVWLPHNWSLALFSHIPKSGFLWTRLTHIYIVLQDDCFPVRWQCP